jgi:hypothetical protein
MANNRIALPGQLVYLAGPMSGLPFEECRKWRDKATRYLNKLVDPRTGEHMYHVLNPLRGHVELIGGDCTPCYDDVSAERADIRRDRYDVNRGDIILADLTDAKRIADIILDRLFEQVNAQYPNGENREIRDALKAFLASEVKPLLPRSSIGTVCELDQAHLEGKFIILVMTQDNPHWHSFIKDMAAVIFPTLDEALKYMRHVLNVATVVTEK